MHMVRLVIVSILLCVYHGQGLPRFANYFQDHMVLQRAPQRAVVWGYGESSVLTILQMNDKIYTTISRTESINDFGESIWSVTLDPVSDEGPFDIQVSQELINGSVIIITIHDVLFGDVWICSGQSNMQMAVSDIFNATEEINNANNYPKIRVFTAALKASTIPIEELLGIVENWSIASAKSIGGPSFAYMSAVCWLYGRMIHVALNNRPIGLVATSWGGTAIELWMPPEALHECGISSNEQVHLQSYGQPLQILTLDNSNLFNAMIYPFTRMVIYGIIWYQGEANADYNRDKYSCSFSKMIQYWRQTWNQRTNNLTDIEFPFGFVQLSTWSSTSDRIGGFPWIRWHQTFDIGHVPNHIISNVFMAVSLDLRDDPNGIHPRTKHDVAYRLSRAGLAIAYNQQIEFQGPLISNISIEIGDKNINITYDNVKSIEIRNDTGFEACCLGSRCLNDSETWVPAPITSKNNLTITIAVAFGCVGQIINGLRYLWHETPCPFKQAAIYSGTDGNLPSPPYIQYF